MPPGPVPPQEEQDKRSARASRFNIEAPSQLLQYKPDEELEARARRAKKFGVAYQPTDAVLMDMGEGGRGGG